MEVITTIILFFTLINTIAIFMLGDIIIKNQKCWGEKTTKT